jgi:hypothetical protein
VKKEKEIAVLVTTEYRGVFFGYVPSGTDLNCTEIRLERARLCVYWSADVRGFMGLAANGPSKDCKIGPQVTAITLQRVTSISEVSEKAKNNWENENWG